MKFVVALSFVLGLCGARTLDNLKLAAEWGEFKALHGKVYSSPEVEELRMKVYMNNKQLIESHNERFKQGLVSYTMKMNHFGDMLKHEVVQSRNGLVQRPAGLRSSNRVFNATGVNLPTEIDWRDQGAVTDVKDQGQCGSCWAFSATGALEGQMLLRKSRLVSLSEQQLVDCSALDGNDGCEGGFMEKAFNYVRDAGGIESEADYPYKALDSICKFDNTKTLMRVDYYTSTEIGNESDLQAAIVSTGPIAVGIDASSQSFHFYEDGVYDEEQCSSSVLDHGVLAVGYGVESGLPYWLVKNSWGPQWGSSGYIKMRRNHNNMCGIATQASYPIVI